MPAAPAVADLNVRKGLQAVTTATAASPVSAESCCSATAAGTATAPSHPDSDTPNADTGPLPDLRSIFSGEWRQHSGELSEGPSESSAGSSHTFLSDEDFQSKIPHLERFYEQLAAKARLPVRQGPGASNWVLSLARSYRRLSNDKRRRGRLRALLREVSRDGDAGLCARQGLASSEFIGGGRGLPGSCLNPGTGCLPGQTATVELPGFSSATDDSGYEAGYETDADESEIDLSECESGSRPQRHKRKLDALVQLTMRLNVSGRTEEETESAMVTEADAIAPPFKTPRAVAGLQPANMFRSAAPPPPPPFCCTMQGGSLASPSLPEPTPMLVGASTSSAQGPQGGAGTMSTEATLMDVG